MFIGRHFHSLDGKGRVAIPHKFRGELGGANAGRLIVTVSPSEQYSYLDAYPAHQWEDTIERILATPITGEDAASVREALLANYIHPAQEQSLDSQGRILISPDQRQAARLEKDVVFTGDMQRFRIWSRSEWERYDAIAAKDKAKVLKIPGLWV
jgi:MraZ protein